MAIKRKTSRKSKKAIGRVRVGKNKNISVTLSLGSILAFVLFGLLFGYFLSKGQVTDYDSVVQMFMVKEFQLYGVFGVAILVVAAGLFFLNRLESPTLSGDPLMWKPVKFKYSRLIGAFVFGAGWALAGSSPGAVVTQLGEGKVYAIFTILGILAGVWIFQKWKPKSIGDDNC